MARRRGKSRAGDDSEESLAGYVSSAIERLTRLAQSKQPSDKGRVLNTTIFIVVVSFAITHLIIYPDSLWSLSGIFLLFLSGIISFLVGAFLYERWLNILVKLSADEMSSNRLGAIVLLVAYPLALTGLIFGIPVLIFLTFGMIALQTMVLLIYSVFPFVRFGEGGATNQKGLFGGMGVIAFSITILDIVVTIVSIIVSLTH